MEYLVCLLSTLVDYIPTHHLYHLSESSAAATNYTIDTLPGCYPDDEGQIIESVYVDPLTHDGAEYLVSDELANLSEADIHVLAAEDVDAGQHQIKQEEVDIIDVKPRTVVVEAPVVKSPTGGGLIYLQKLKKVKKPKKNKDKPEGQRSVKEFFTKKNKN